MALSVPRFLPTKTYPFTNLRHAYAATGIQAGVMAQVSTTEFKVTQDTGANMNSKVAQGDSGAWVPGLDTSRQGFYHQYNDAAVTLTHTAANGTNPRIDQIVLRVYDSNIIGGGLDQASFEIIAGTPTAGATLDNRNGAVNLATIAAPKSLILLADVLIPAASAAVTNANIRDRRPWARGAHRTLTVTAGNYTRTSSTYVEVDTTNLKPRVECSGVPVKVTLVGDMQAGAAGRTMGLDLFVDSTSVALKRFKSSVVAGIAEEMAITWTYTPSAGNHQFAPAFASLDNVNTVQINATATDPLQLTIEEIVRQNADNT